MSGALLPSQPAHTGAGADDLRAMQCGGLLLQPQPAPSGAGAAMGADGGVGMAVAVAMPDELARRAI
eukprot:9592665-Alexandrium_andersonii.AAC.1